MKIRTNYLGAGQSVTIPLCTEALFNNDALSLTVDWGDGSSQTITSFGASDTINHQGSPVGYKLTHTYAAKGRKVITLTGGYGNKLAFMPTVAHNASGEAKNTTSGGTRWKIEKIYECNVGTQFYIHGQGDFRGMGRLTAIGKNISALTSASPATAIALDTSASAGMLMDKTFAGCPKLKWFGDFSPVNAQSLQFTFFGCQTMSKAFHINNWDLAKVISAKGAFKNTVISVNLNKLFKTQSGVNYQITDMSHMFEGSNFNKGINDWDMRTVENTSRMFKGSQFNQNIWKWFKADASITYALTNMVSMFENSAFTRGIAGWDVSSVVKANAVFKGAQFANDVSSWDLSSADVSNFRANNSNMGDGAIPQSVTNAEGGNSGGSGSTGTPLTSTEVQQLIANTATTLGSTQNIISNQGGISGYASKTFGYSTNPLQTLTASDVSVTTDTSNIADQALTNVTVHSTVEALNQGKNNTSSGITINEQFIPISWFKDWYDTNNSAAIVSDNNNATTNRYSAGTVLDYDSKISFSNMSNNGYLGGYSPAPIVMIDDDHGIMFLQDTLERIGLFNQSNVSLADEGYTGASVISVGNGSTFHFNALQNISPVPGTLYAMRGSAYGTVYGVAGTPGSYSEEFHNHLYNAIPGWKKVSVSQTNGYAFTYHAAYDSQAPIYLKGDAANSADNMVNMTFTYPSGNTGNDDKRVITLDLRKTTLGLLQDVDDLYNAQGSAPAMVDRTLTNGNRWGYVILKFTV